MRVTLVVLWVCGLAACTSNPRVDVDEPKSFDGLLPIASTTLDRVWAREGFDVTGYTKLMLQGSEIGYRPVKDMGPAGVRRGATEFPLTERQKDTLEAILDEEFRKALDELERYELVDSPGSDVLLLRANLIDVVSKIPPERPGRVDYYLESVGHATLVVEFVDSQSDAVLLRGIDTRSAKTIGVALPSSPATNATEVRRVARFWAQLLVEGLNETTTLQAALSE
jgi:hypothetical protein